MVFLMHTTSHLDQVQKSRKVNLWFMMETAIKAGWLDWNPHQLITWLYLNIMVRVQVPSI